jgi:hypothetical protein
MFSIRNVFAGQSGTLAGIRQKRGGRKMRGTPKREGKLYLRAEALTF